MKKPARKLVCIYKRRKAACNVQKKPGSYLLSHGRAAVPSALGRFTSVFGKGTGISTLLWPPGDHMGHRELDGPMIRSEPER